MLTLFYAPNACSMAAHIVLEESGQKYEAKKMDLCEGRAETPEYLKIHPLGRVPALRLDDGTPLSENTAILPFLGKRFGLWPLDPVSEAKALSTIGFFASSVHPAHAHIGRPERYTEDKSAYPGHQGDGQEDLPRLPEADRRHARPAANGSCDRYSVLDPYAFVFYAWGVRRELPMAELRTTPRSRTACSGARRCSAWSPTRA